MPGKPLIYATSKSFMDYFGINSPEDLPKLREVFAEAFVEPTIIAHDIIPDEPIIEDPIVEKPVLVVSEDGELRENGDNRSEENPSEESDKPDE
jgi:segregation and condensation protein B